MARKKSLQVTSDVVIDFQEGGKKKSLSSIIATRERSIDFISAFSVYLPNPDPVLKKTGKDIKTYRDLLSDAHVGAAVQSRKSGVKCLEWEIDRGKSKSRQAKLITDVFNALDLNRILGEILDAPLFGYSPIEVIWERQGQYILPADLVGKPPEWFNFSVENELQFRTKEKWQGEPITVERKFLLSRYNPTYENPYGENVLSKCFWPVTFKRGGMKFWVVFTEKYGMPFAIGKHPRGASDKERTDILGMLENMVRDAVATIPDDSSVDLLEPTGKTASTDIFERLLTFSNQEISKAILGQTLTTEMQDVGSYASAKVHLDVRYDIVQADKKLAEQTLNELIKWIYEINFGDTDNRATFTLYEEEEVDKTLAERDQTLTNSGVKFTKKYFMKAYGFEEEDIEEDTNKPTPSQFQETDDLEDDNSLIDSQLALDQLASAIGMNKEMLQEEINGSLNPILQMIKEGKGESEILENLILLHPYMDTSILELRLAKARFIAETWGRLRAN